MRESSSTETDRVSKRIVTVSMNFTPTHISRVCLVTVLFFISCSTARFNTFYNARQNYKEALRLAETRNTGSKPSSGEIAKLDKCLEKCGVIIARHPGSSLVDDALFLMGKALSLKQEHATSAEKFSELREYFPESEFVGPSLYLEAVERRALAQWARAENLIETHLNTSDTWSVWQERSAVLYAEIAESNGRYDQALSRIEQPLTRSKRKEIVGPAYLLKGRSLRGTGELEAAMDAFRQASEHADTHSRRFEAQVEMGETASLLGRGEESLEIFRDLTAFARADSELAQVGLSIGRSWRSLSDFNEAEEAWRNVILAYPRETASKYARMELASMLETEQGDLSAALVEYDELAKQGRPRDLVTRASRRAKALRAVEQLGLSLQDSSLNRGSNLMKLGDTFFFNLELPDSALPYYAKAHAEFPESSWAARALYAEIRIRREHQSTGNGVIDSLLGTLTSRYPHSAQARSIRVMSGELPESTYGLSKAGWFYERAEEIWLDNDDFTAALDTFTMIADSFPTSPIAPKALLASAWISGEDLGDSVGTRAFLQRILDSYPKSEEASYASRVLGVSLIDKKLPYDTAPSIVRIDTVECAEIAPVDSLHRLGIVRVRVLVDANGEAKNVELVKGTQSLLCDDAAIQTARIAEYTPAQKDSISVEAWFDVDVPFVPTRADST